MSLAYVKNRVLFSIAVLTLVAVPSAFSFAQTSSSTGQVSSATSTTQATLLATVNIQNATFKQSGNVFNLSFDITNRVIPQTGVLYSVMLVGSTTAGQFVADQKVYPDSLTLAENSSIHKEVTYTAPPSLNGNYDLVLSSKNASGFPFAINKVAYITLKATGGIEAQTDTCYLTIPGDKTPVSVGTSTGVTTPLYTLLQGVDIAPTESLVLHCAVQNHGSATTVTPHYETHYRTVYGDVVAQTGGDTAAIPFSADEKKTISLTLPKATTPQAFDVLIRLGEGSNASNQIDVHYVIQGESATIQNLSLDKNYYAKGETALLSILWSPAADTFLGSRRSITAGTSTPPALDVTMTVTVVDKNNAACITPLTEGASKDMNTKVPLLILSDCTNPHLSVDLKDASGKVIAHQDITLTSDIPPRNTTTIIEIALALLVAVAMLIAGFFYYKKRHVAKV